MDNYKIIEATDSIWDDYLKCMPVDKQDIYFSSWYYRLEEIEEHGHPQLFVYEDGENIAIYPYLINEIPDKYGFKGYYDIETAYGYGGPLANSENQEFLIAFENEFIGYCRKENIIAEFIRFHPLIKNYNIFKNNISVLHNRTTVWVNLQKTENDLWMSEISSRYRNKIRNAQKSGLRYEESKDYQEFMRMYDMTMKKDNADDFYFFSENYFKYLMERKDNIILYIKDANGRIIAGILLMGYGDYLHYHLGCSDTDYLNLHSNNFMQWKAIEWGLCREYKRYHLGGGLSDDEGDHLFQFKRGFSKDRANFYIGKRIHNHEIYDQLMNKWEEENGRRSVKLLAYRD